METRICLGTAQIGFDYGIANARRRPNDEACNELLSRAVERGVLRWDTARTYGDSEQRIGAFLSGCSRRDEIQIVSKLPTLPAGLSSSDLRAWVTEETDASLKALHIERLAAWLIHDPGSLVRYGAALWDAMAAQVDRGVVQRVGASVYDVREAQLAIKEQITGAVQLTMNLLDDRFGQAGILDQCAECGITVYARSVFLQGVLTMSPDSLTMHLSHLQLPLKKLRAILESHGLQPMDVALPYVLLQPQVDFAVIGVDDTSQLDDNLAEAARALPSGLAAQIRSSFGNLSPDVLEPRRWTPPT